MRRIHIFLFATLTIIGCSSPNEIYVRDAIQQMDRKGLYAKGEEWEAMKKEALSQEPETLEEAQETINKAAKVAGGKHSYLMPANKAQAILDARNLYQDCSLANLYETKDEWMYPELIKAHQENDKAVMEAYGFNWKNMTEADIVAALFKLYQELTQK